MALAGTLRDFSLADIFQLIGLQKKTGVLTLTNEKEEARILFMNGLVVGADTNSQKLENRLGHVLVQSNRISQAELDQALASQGNTLQRLGQVLVQKGFIKQEDLRDSLQTQTTQIIYRLFRWLDGEYSFRQERFVDYDQENFSPITSESILMEGVRMLDEWPMIEKVIPHFEIMVERTSKGKNVKLHVEDKFSINASGDESFNSLLEDVMADSQSDTSKVKSGNNLSHSQELVLKLVTGPIIVQDVIDRGGMNEFETCRALYDLFDMGLVQRVREDYLDGSIRVIEKEQHIPLWIPATLVALIALLSYLAGWNPGNRFFPLPAQMNRTPPQFEATTAYQLFKISTALDHYYLEKEEVPLTLDILVRGAMLQPSDIVDAYGRDFHFHPQINKDRYLLSGRDPSGRRSETQFVEKQY